VFVSNAMAGSLVSMCFVGVGPYHSSHTVVDGLNGSSVCLTVLLIKRRTQSHAQRNVLCTIRVHVQQ
jgi:hypothetical protein